ncbi:MAG: metallophosphoesterase [Anaerolineales bacterium]
MPRTTKPHIEPAHSRRLRQFQISSLNLFLYGLLWIAVLLLAGCASPLDQLRTATPVASTSAPTATFKFTATVTPSPVFTATPSPSPLPASSPTATETPLPPLRFAVIGDYGGNGPPERDVAEMVKGWQPEFVITTGDNNYPLGSAETIDLTIGQYYQEFIYPYKGQFGPGADQNRFFPSLGNHDWMTDQARPYLDYFELPGNERYYDFVWEPVHFFVLDSDSHEPDGFRADSAQATWLKERLANSSEPWKVVYFHHAPYSSGVHGSVTWMRWPFQEWGASVVLSGHDHTYERLSIDGFPYFVNGLGGGSRYNFENITDGSQARYNADYGAMLVTASEQEMLFEFYARTGELIDTFSLRN